MISRVHNSSNEDESIQAAGSESFRRDENPSVADEARRLAGWNINEIVSELRTQAARRDRRAAKGLGVLLTGFVLMLAALRLSPNISDSWMTPLLVVLLMFPVFSAIALSWPSRREREGLQILADQARKEDVGALVELQAQMQPVRTQRAITETLIKMLPSLNTSDSHLLTAKQRHRLNEVLEDRYKMPWEAKAGADLAVAILRAYEQVGDEDSLRAVKRLAESRGVTEWQRRIRDAAVDCLPALEARVSKAKSPSVLLRPSASPGDAHGLLRAAGSPESVDADLLLRFVGSADESTVDCLRA